MSKPKRAKTKKRPGTGAGALTATTFQAALEALDGLDDDARRSGADGLTLAEINQLIREVRRERKHERQGKTA